MSWFIFLLIVGICFSGYMTVRTAKDEREKEDVIIEQEGKLYMERLEKEKEKRTHVYSNGS
ncbi:sporulation YhaL family protein [Sutcliffiella cohnii]|uniref:SigE-dependent sporulation protein n=1 Tax=Sutcliffiella cohnii TaxID=33932 RepID=A0A223KLV3_9BACI|nr:MULTISPECIES: sporulation YhaL family protein [Sutcliffiella]AST90480.1 SigE-dependent sporulation protein [Sutcliffiella cohnii]MED4017401.1 sporulation YhaL family protein [Sutcliffiella cohnii]WBL16133.1 sporulation YhaL family protein [Sutcliffiella sp. NC1]